MAMTEAELLESLRSRFGRVEAHGEPGGWVVQVYSDSLGYCLFEEGRGETLPAALAALTTAIVDCS